MNWVYLYPAHSSDRKVFLQRSVACDLASNLFLKECLLTGLAIRSIGVDEVHAAVAAGFDGRARLWEEWRGLSLVHLVGFSDGLGRADRFPVPGDQERVERFMIDTWYRHNIGFVLSGHAEPSKLGNGWGSRILGILDSRTTLTFAIGG
jgi:hypothetical protein